MSADDLQGYRLRYILAKLNQSLEVAAYGETEGTKWLKNYTASEFEVEHIHPSDPRHEAITEFGNLSAPGVVNQLGNLVLVEKPINASLGNKEFSKKKLVYPQSRLLFVRAISERPKVGTNTSIDRAVRDLEPFQSWNEVNINLRQSQMGKLARLIWNIPPPTSK